MDALITYLCSSSLVLVVVKTLLSSLHRFGSKIDWDVGGTKEYNLLSQFHELLLVSCSIDIGFCKFWFEGGLKLLAILLMNINSENLPSWV